MLRAVAAAAVGLLVPAQAEARTLPVGTPYAAEVSAEITGTVKVSEDTTSRIENVCEAEPQLFAQQATYLLRWHATFPHVTVPVATQAQLGRAYHRLHVPVTPTSAGTGGLTGAGWSISGSAPTRNDACDAVRYAESGRLGAAAGDPPSVAERIATVDAGAGPTRRALIGFRLGGFGSSSPAEVQGTAVTALAFGAFKIFDAPAVTDALSNPPPVWNGVTLDLPPERFAALVRHPRVTIPLTDAGTEDCGTKADPGISAFTCSTQHDFAYTVILHKKLLYTSRRAYPR